MKQKGFTIVELLIVIVVIAILATISIVAYSGIQQRAKNTAIVDAASKSLRLVQAYIAANGTYPMAAAVNACVTSTSGCNNGSATIGSYATFDNNMATIGTLPRSIPAASSNEYGLWFTYNSGVTLNGVSQPMLILYYLSGTSQKCGVDNVVNYTWPALTSSTTGYTQNTANGNTRCWASVPGPSV